MPPLRITDAHRPLTAQLFPGSPKTRRFSKTTSLMSPRHSTYELKVGAGFVVSKRVFWCGRDNFEGVLHEMLCPLDTSVSDF